MYKSRGFTLIELMVVAVIIAIISAIALPAYTQYSIKTRRAAAAGCLSELAQFMERYRTTSMTYTGAKLPSTSCTSDTAKYYTYDFAKDQPKATTFTIQATPIGGQADDTKCATLGINELGEKTVSGSDTVASCW